MSGHRVTAFRSSCMLLVFLASGPGVGEATAQEGTLRVENAAAEQENGEVQEVRRRLKVMRTAVEALVEAGQHDRAEVVERAMHARELILERRTDAEAMSVREAAPDRGVLSRQLAAAAELYADWGAAEKARALAELSETYAQQFRRRQRVEAGGAAGEPRGELDLESLEQRVEILSLAAELNGAAGKEKNAAALARTVELGRRLIRGEDVSDSDVAGIPSFPNLAELLLVSARIADERGNERHVHSLKALAEYYMKRAREQREEEDEGHERDGEREHGEQGGHEGEHEHDGEHEHGGDINELGYRIDILRMARKAFAEAGDREHAGRMERFIHGAELQQSGAPEEQIVQAFEGFSMGLVIELLQRASRLWREFGHAPQAEACNELAEFYVRRERERGGEGERQERDRPERHRDWNLEDRAQRMEILRLARAAHAEAGHREAAGQMERILHLAELQLEGADDAAISEAAQGLSQEMIIDLVRQASGLYAEWGNAGRARSCELLTQYYLERAQGQGMEPAGSGLEERERDRERDTRMGRDRVERILQRIERMEAELRELKQEIRDLLRR